MVLRGIGRVFITVGTLVLLFLGYQVFGTNAVTNNHQAALADDIKKDFEVARSGNGAPAAAKPNIGDGMAIIKIPKIAVDSVVVEGVGVQDLKKGPGHNPTTAYPGETGNMVVSGHRTTYGAPFIRTDELVKGDSIEVTDRSGTYTYKVTDKKIVAPSDVSVITPTTDARLTLTTCHPKFSAKQRLIIVAALEGKPKAA